MYRDISLLNVFLTLGFIIKRVTLFHLYNFIVKYPL